VIYPLEARFVFPSAPRGSNCSRLNSWFFSGRHDDQVDAVTYGLAWGRVKKTNFQSGVVRGLF